jgi:hypothetical protein
MMIKRQLKNARIFVVSAVAASFLVITAQADDRTATLPRSFKECVERGGKIEATQQTVCVFNNALRFVQLEESASKSCVDHCGDGICQEIVCMAVGCPCAETTDSCRKDCSS